MIDSVPLSVAVVLVVCFFFQKKYAARYKEHNMKREAVFTLVSGYVCLGLAAFAVVLRIFN